MSYIERADEALASAKDALEDGHLETAVSRAYYACFYSVHSQLAKRKQIASSHKQTGIKFRELFIKTGLLDKNFSDILKGLEKWRMDVDYAPCPEITPKKAAELVKKAEEFVTALSRV